MLIPEDVEQSVSYAGEASTANPSNITQLMGPFDLKIDRTYKGTGTTQNGDVVLIDESAILMVDSPMVPDQTESFKLAVDRKTCEHLEEEGNDWDFARSGRFTFGIHPEKEDIEFWLHDINDTVLAKYDGTTVYEGINVIKYSMNDYGLVTKNQKLVERFAAVAIYLGNSNLNSLYFREDSMVYVDEISGLIVYIERNSEFYGDVTHKLTNQNQTIIFSKMSYTFDDETSKDLIKQAKDTGALIQMFEIFIPLTFMIIGFVLILVSVALRVRLVNKEKKMSEEMNSKLDID